MRWRTMAMLMSAMVTGGGAVSGGAMADGSSESTVSRVSVSNHENQGNRDCFGSSISDDGRYVAFASRASNLVRGDTNGRVDVFVRDRTKGTTRRVSVSSQEKQGNRNSGSDRLGRPVISADGRYVVFASQATNLVPGDTNGLADVFVRNRVTGKTSRVSITKSGRQSKGSSVRPAMSSQGRYVTYISTATNLVRGDTNRVADVYIRNRATRGVQRVSVSSREAQAELLSYETAVSDDGRYVAFVSSASNLVPGDTNGALDVFVRDRAAGTTERASVSSLGRESEFGGNEISMSRQGNLVAFTSFSPDLVTGDANGQWDVFVRDLAARTTERVSVTTQEAEANGIEPALSGDGRYVAFGSSAPNLVGGRPGVSLPGNVFVRDRSAGTTRLASGAANGTPGDGNSHDLALSSNGRYVAFMSSATNLVADDTNKFEDVFVATN